MFEIKILPGGILMLFVHMRVTGGMQHIACGYFVWHSGAVVTFPMSWSQKQCACGCIERSMVEEMKDAGNEVTRVISHVEESIYGIVDIAVYIYACAYGSAANQSLCSNLLRHSSGNDAGDIYT
jgi:hypothetical protein